MIFNYYAQPGRVGLTAIANFYSADISRALPSRREYGAVLCSHQEHVLPVYRDDGYTAEVFVTGLYVRSI